MAIPVSSAPSVKAAVVTGVTSTVNDPTVLVAYDLPAANLPDDMILVGPIERRLEPHALVGTLGAGAFLERYAIEVTVSCYRGGNNAQAAEERAFVLLGNVETFIRNDPSVGALVYLAEPATSRTETVWTDDHLGFVSTITLVLQFNAVS